MNNELQQFVIKKLREPEEKQLDKNIEWFCDSMGLISIAGKNKSCPQILKALAKSAQRGKGLTSEELTKLVKPTGGSVFPHLKKLMKAGLVVKAGSTLKLRKGTLLITIEEIEREILQSLTDIKKIAANIDSPE